MANFSFNSGGAMKNQPPQRTPPMGGSPADRALMGAPPPIPLIPPASSGEHSIKSHSVKHADGTTITQTFHPPMDKQAGLLGKKAAPKTPSAPSQPEQSQQPQTNERKYSIDGKDYDGHQQIPYIGQDGKVAFMSANGQQ